MTSQCKICLKNDNTQDFISPCSCHLQNKFVHQNCLEKWIKTSNRLLPDLYYRTKSIYVVKCEFCNYDMKYLIEYKNNIIKSLWSMVRSMFTSFKNISVLSIHFMIVFFFTKRISSFLYETFALLKTCFNPEAVMKFIQNISILFSILVGLKDIYLFYTNIYYEKRCSMIKFLQNADNNNSVV